MYHWIVEREIESLLTFSNFHTRYSNYFDYILGIFWMAKFKLLSNHIYIYNIIYF